MFSRVLAIIQVLFDAKSGRAALGAYGTTIGLGTILGPLAGGLLIQASITADAWRPIFLVNVPIGVAALTAALILLPESRAPRRPRLDVPGAILSAAGLGLVLYPLAEGRARGWPAWLDVMLAAGVLVLTGFALYERQLSRSDRDPILDTRLFSDRAFRIGTLLNVLFYAGVPGFFLVFSLYLQSGAGFSALGAGLAIFAYSIGAAITASSADTVARKVGNRVLAIGAAGLVAGMLALIATTVLAGVHPHIYDWIPAMTISGLGFGLFVPPVIDIVLVNVSRERAGIASGALATMQQVGGAVGVAVIGIIFFGLVGHNASQAARNASPTVAAAVHAASAPASASARAAAVFEQCFTWRARSADPTVTPPG